MDITREAGRLENVGLLLDLVLADAKEDGDVEPAVTVIREVNSAVEHIQAAIDVLEGRDRS